jgi:hypothetical protein
LNGPNVEHQHEGREGPTRRDALFGFGTKQAQIYIKDSEVWTDYRIRRTHFIAEKVRLKCQINLHLQKVRILLYEKIQQLEERGRRETDNVIKIPFHFSDQHTTQPLFIMNEQQHKEKPRITNLNGNTPSTIETLSTLYVSVDYMSLVVCKIDK